jgi:amidase
MSTQHACTVTVRDSAALLDVAGVPDSGDPYWAPPGPASYLAALAMPPGCLRIALSTRAPNGASVHSDCVEAASRTAALCQDLGHEILEVDLSIDWNDGYGEAATIIPGVGMHANIQAKSRATGREVKDGDFCPAVCEFLKVGQTTSAADYYLAVRKLHSLSRRMAQFHMTYDMLLTPSLTVPPPLLSEFDYGPGGAAGFLGQFWNVAAFMPLANATGQPAMTVPLWSNAAGLPIGSHFVARFGDGESLLRLAAQLEAAAPWFARKPAVATAS